MGQSGDGVGCDFVDDGDPNAVAQQGTAHIGYSSAARAGYSRDGTQEVRPTCGTRRVVGALHKPNTFGSKLRDGSRSRKRTEALGSL